jgi:hypothetical protein
MEFFITNERKHKIGEKARVLRVFGIDFYSCFPKSVLFSCQQIRRTKMSNTILTRMGDGEKVTMSPSEIKAEINRGTDNASELARIPVLTDDDIEHLFDIIAEPGRVVSVPHGHELIVTDDGIAECFAGTEADGGSGVSVSRQASVLSYERALAADTGSLGHSGLQRSNRSRPSWTWSFRPTTTSPC